MVGNVLDRMVGNVLDEIQSNVLDEMIGSGGYARKQRDKI